MDTRGFYNIIRFRTVDSINICGNQKVKIAIYFILEIIESNQAVVFLKRGNFLPFPLRKIYSFLLYWIQDALSRRSPGHEYVKDISFYGGKSSFPFTLVFFFFQLPDAYQIPLSLTNSSALIKFYYFPLISMSLKLFIQSVNMNWIQKHKTRHKGKILQIKIKIVFDLRSYTIKIHHQTKGWWTGRLIYRIDIITKGWRWYTRINTDDKTTAEKISLIIYIIIHETLLIIKPLKF